MGNGIGQNKGKVSRIIRTRKAQASVTGTSPKSGTSIVDPRLIGDYELALFLKADRLVEVLLFVVDRFP